MKTQCDLVRADLAGRIGRLALQRMRLGDRYEPGGAIDLAGRGVDHPFDAQIPRRLNDVQRAQNIGLNIGLRRVIAVGNGDQGREVQHHVAAGHGRTYPVRVANVAGEDVQILADVRRAVVQPAPATQAVVLDEGAHVAAAPHQPLDQMRADEAVRASDQYALAVQMH